MDVNEGISIFGSRKLRQSHPRTFIFLVKWKIWLGLQVRGKEQVFEEFFKFEMAIISRERDGITKYIKFTDTPQFVEVDIQ